MAAPNTFCTAHDPAVQPKRDEVGGSNTHGAHACTTVGGDGNRGNVGARVPAGKFTMSPEEEAQEKVARFREQKRRNQKAYRERKKVLCGR